jgi:BolA protein
MSEMRVDRIRRALSEAFSPELLEIEDESHLHAGHAGARDGRGHFRVTIVSEAFEGRARLERHRLVFAALGDMMDTDIHALAVQAHSPSEI